MTNTEIVMKLIGNINPVGDASRDGERLENLKALCDLVRDLITKIDDVSYNNRDAYESSVVKARDYASNFLTRDLGIVND